MRDQLVARWRASAIGARIGLLFVTIFVSVVALYGIGNMALYYTIPTNDKYVIARTSVSDITDVDVKLSTSAWNVAPVPAKNVTNQALSVGDAVNVQTYWWFGAHTTVKDVQ